MSQNRSEVGFSVGADKKYVNFEETAIGGCCDEQVATRFKFGPIAADKFWRYRAYVIEIGGCQGHGHGF